MKNTLLTITTLASVAFAGLSVGVGSSGDVSVGWRWGRFVPYLSPSFVNSSGSYAYYFRSHNDNLPPGYQDTEQNDTTAFNAGLLLASLGCRGVFGSGELKPVVRVAAGLPIPVYLRLSSNDSTGQAQLDSLKSRLYRNPSPTVVLAAAVGLETAVSRRVAIGGELNYSYLFGGAWIKNRHSENEDGTYWEQEESNVRLTVGKIGAGLWVNFYF